MEKDRRSGEERGEATVAAAVSLHGRRRETVNGNGEMGIFSLFYYYIFFFNFNFFKLKFGLSLAF